MDTQKTTEFAVACDVKREKVRVIPIQFFDDFPKHPLYITFSLNTLRTFLA